ncbi:zf-HC2 domain-containing protein [Streptomyces sp. G44]|uniref:zf-HC2 domain-containing protein n=1 Tax=Streptomyces sp. G44 TaxID=2807632 RepID=UPI0019622163|nr:zf-HC2 domain-containing protein [Streptomyces sp. G44]MBM7167001.1 zf-HC2 domain-containing protein [Streptomyces sp. G44]
MRSQERHRDAGAYTLGVLDEADTFRFEDHLAGCAACVSALDELRSPARQLALYCRVTPAAVAPCAAPGAGLLERALRELARRHAARRRGRWCALALAVVLALGTSAVALVSAAGSGPERVSARDARSGVLGTLAARERAWGTELALTVHDPGPAARVCALVAVGTDGAEHTVATWRTRAARTVEIPAAAALRPGRTDRYEVRTADGQRLLTLRP